MKIFVSWSGDFSKAMAGILHTFLPEIIQELEVFSSDHDIPSGERWSLKLANQLEAAAFGILCLTPDNLHNDWLLFEAGALTKHAEGCACCLLFGLRPAQLTTGPLLQFQNRTFDKEGMRSLICDLNKKATKSRQNIDRAFDKWWPDIEAEHRRVSLHPPEPPAKREPGEVLDEILLRVRGIERSLQLKSETAHTAHDPKLILVTPPELVGDSPDSILLSSEEEEEDSSE